MTPSDRLRVTGPAWSIRDGRLWVEDVACSELAARFGTPLYVISESRLRNNARRLTAALAAAWPYGQARLLPSLKANPTLATRAILNEEGVGCDTFGETELVAALRAGVPGEQISVNGASKSERLVTLAVASGARITLDSARELPLVEAAAARAAVRARVRLRVRPRLVGLEEPSDLASDAASVREVFQAYKAGIPIDDCPELGRAALSSSHVELVGVHVHFARQTASVELWQAQMESFVELLAELSVAWSGWLPTEIDIGGGWPSGTDPVGRRSMSGRARPFPDDAAHYATASASALAAALAARGLARDGMILEAEPGRAMYADAGIHLATVTNVKSQRDPEPHRWVETDTSEVFLPDTLLEASLFPVIAVDHADCDASDRVDVTGISCNFDLIAPAVELPTVEPGDVLAFFSTGAYQEAAASNFNGLPRPATVLVNGSSAEVIKRAETVEEVLSRNIIPSRLARPGAPVRVRGVDHVGLTVADIDRALEFWSGTLGLPILERGISTDAALADLVGVAAVEVEIADLDAGDGRIIELIAYRTPTLRAGAVHIAVCVDDLAGVLDSMPGSGAQRISRRPVTLEAPGSSWDGVTCCYVADADGVQVELVQRPTTQ